MTAPLALQQGDRLLVVGAPPRAWLDQLVHQIGALPYLVLPTDTPAPGDSDLRPTPAPTYAGYLVFRGTMAQFLDVAGQRPAEFAFHHLLLVSDSALQGVAPQLHERLRGLIHPGGQLITLPAPGQLDWGVDCPRSPLPVPDPLDLGMDSPARPGALQVRRTLQPGELGIVYRTILFDSSGYAAESRDFIRELVRREHVVQVEPVGAGPPGPLAPDAVTFYGQLAAHAIPPARAVHVTVGPPLYVQPPPGYRRTVLRTMFEAETIPRSWAATCNQFDEVWVPSRQSRTAFAASGVQPEKLQIIPGAVETERFHPGALPLSLPGRRGFQFLSVFDWQYRKGWDLLLTAYLQEFTPSEDVALYLKVHQLSHQTNIAGELLYWVRSHLGRSPAETPTIILLDGELDAAAMPGLYTACDAFVLPSRGEGYGRPYLEAMACGLPVIGTAWGGQADFLTPETGYPVACDGMEAVSPHEPIRIYRGLSWARPSLAGLRAQLRAVFQDPTAARSKGRTAAQVMSTHWHPGVAAAAIAGRLQAIAAEEGELPWPSTAAT